LALIVSKGEVVTSALDPLAYFTGGTLKLSMTTGNQIASSAFQVFVGGSAKSTGIGDLIALCQAQPIQIGNYVWKDSDKDGVQDPCETPLSNITVSLWKSGTQIATTTTNSSGEYYFSDKNVVGVTWTGTGADTTLQIDMAYEIRINNTNQTILDTMRLTIANSTTNNGNDINDSDASIAGNYSVISLTTGGAGTTNHSYDFGFYPCFVPSLLDTTISVCTSQNINLTNLVRDIAVKTKDSTNQRYFRYFHSNWTDVTDSTTVNMTVTDSFYIIKDVFNCYANDTLKVVVNVTPVPTAPVLSSPQTNTCPTAAVDLTTLAATLTPSVSGGVFEWHVSNNSGSALVSSPTAATDGIYYLFEKSPADCYSTGTAIQVQTVVCCPTPLCIPLVVTRTINSN
jgi:SdrD B-like domain